MGCGYYGRNVNINELVGQTINHVKGLEKGSDQVDITTLEGNRYRMYHSQNCCENVELEDLDGSVEDLVGGLVVSAEESTGETPNDYKFEYEPNSYTWTFYKIETSKGGVFMRWLGESNGYYSEDVDFVKLNEEDC